MVLEKESYKDIVDNLPEGIAVCSSQGKIIDVNKNFERLTGYSKVELLGQIAEDFIISTETECQKCAQSLGIDEEYKPKSFYLGELRDKNDSFTCIRINSSKTRDGKIIFLVIPLSDVAFLNKAHIDFVSTVSHELRTPLTSIKGFADTMISSGDRLSPEQQKRFLGIIKNQVDRLTRLVENLLTVSKLESKKDKSIYKAIEFPKLIEGLLSGVQPKIQNHTITLDIMKNLPPIWADSDKFEQVMTNLVDNAIKYSPNGGKVTICAKFAHNSTDYIHVCVQDEGVGIPQEHLSKIFTKFSRIDNPLTRQVEGTGLGLYITKSLIESMNGEITVNSNGKGSVFCITLPVATYEKQIRKDFKRGENR